MLKKLIALLIIAYFGFNLLALINSNKMAFHPPKPSYVLNKQIMLLPTTNNNKIAAIYLPNKNAKYTMLVSHGNAVDLGRTRGFLQRLHDHGFAVMSYDYAGYGLSTGKPSEQAVYEDVTTAYNYLVNNKMIKPQNIIAYGHSLGTAAAIDLAAHHKVAAVIAVSPFTSGARVLTHYRILLFDKFNNLAKIRKINCPLLIIHGTADTVIPFWHGEELFKAAKQPKRFLAIKNAGHNNIPYVAGNKFWQALAEFTNHTVIPAPSTVIPAPSTVIPAPSTVIPAQAGIL